MLYVPILYATLYLWRLCIVLNAPLGNGWVTADWYIFIRADMHRIKSIPHVLIVVILYVLSLLFPGVRAGMLVLLLALLVRPREASEQYCWKRPELGNNYCKSSPWFLNTIGAYYFVVACGVVELR